jgi:hypothetical protein
MGFQNRSLRLGLLTVLLVAMTAIPGAWFAQAPGTAFGPSLSWAGGTPDETLHPQPTPTTLNHSRSVVRLGDYSAERLQAEPAARTDHGNVAALRDRLFALWTFVRATTLRM